MVQVGCYRDQCVALMCLGPILRTTGLSIVLNGTQELLNGKGIAVKDYSKIGEAFRRISNSKFINTAQDIIAILLK